MTDETSRIVKAIQASPYRDLEIEPGRAIMPVRDVSQFEATPIRRE